MSYLHKDDKSYWVTCDYCAGIINVLPGKTPTSEITEGPEHLCDLCNRGKHTKKALKRAYSYKK